jgi:hypothetical protein
MCREAGLVRVAEGTAVCLPEAGTDATFGDAGCADESLDVVKEHHGVVRWRVGEGAQFLLTIQGVLRLLLTIQGVLRPSAVTELCIGASRPRIHPPQGSVSVSGAGFQRCGCPSCPPIALTLDTRVSYMAI